MTIIKIINVHLNNNYVRKQQNKNNYWYIKACTLVLEFVVSNLFRIIFKNTRINKTGIVWCRLFQVESNILLRIITILDAQ